MLRRRKGYDDVADLALRSGEEAASENPEYGLVVEDQLSFGDAAHKPIAAVIEDA